MIKLEPLSAGDLYYWKLNPTGWNFAEYYVTDFSVWILTVRFNILDV